MDGEKRKFDNVVKSKERLLDVTREVASSSENMIALLNDSEIYIFDDSFSALDYQTDLKLRQELKKYMKNATTMIVAQRIGTIMNADKIVVLDKGECVGFGTHKELLDSCEVYKEIALSQLSKEELENA